MRKILILTNPGDPHSFAVQQGLRLKGVEAILWHTTDFPSLQSGSYWLSSDEVRWELSGSEIDLWQACAETIWVRRPKPPVLPDSLHPDDRAFAAREGVAFLRSLQRGIGSKAFWINPPESQSRSSLKSEQLRAARSAGFSIPKSLFSSDPRHIREFLESTPQGVVYKPLTPATWGVPDGVSVLFTSIVTEEDLPEDEMLKLCPGIFQERIEKKWELRITAMGNHLFAAKLRSQEVEEAKTDWRAGLGKVALEPAEIPAAVSRACRKLMEDLQLVFGCFDLIVTPQDDYIFLEVNEMGAFLWIEEALPEMRLLDAFCAFLIQGTAAFHWEESEASLRWQDVADNAEYQLEVAAPQRHVLPP